MKSFYRLVDYNSEYCCLMFSDKQQYFFKLLEKCYYEFYDINLLITEIINYHHLIQKIFVVEIIIDDEVPRLKTTASEIIDLMIDDKIKFGNLLDFRNLETFINFEKNGATSENLMILAEKFGCDRILNYLIGKNYHVPSDIKYLENWHISKFNGIGCEEYCKLFVENSCYYIFSDTTQEIDTQISLDLTSMINFYDIKNLFECSRPLNYILEINIPLYSRNFFIGTNDRQWKTSCYNVLKVMDITNINTFDYLESFKQLDINKIINFAIISGNYCRVEKFIMSKNYQINDLKFMILMAILYEQYGIFELLINCIPINLFYDNTKYNIDYILKCIGISSKFSMECVIENFILTVIVIASITDAVCVLEYMENIIDLEVHEITILQFAQLYDSQNVIDYITVLTNTFSLL
ncbi:hypothetical protein QLL95_gp0445 [Cotonvirus japonicus]|uniref:Ankyrin repeat protein n=1 Tax=Cotonvirus japonicus TaxID=2811091 RepID=A0ABM7NU17_9VIRU|nr:hypothetical protein QLL95_gp0445 [Cotonvirus japonicus]BCS83678.1 hypothetical protein [Cotonvirus japonicus]